MVVYVAESLGQKRNGGSSLSGLEFLQIIRINYTKVVVVTNDRIDHTPQVFYGHHLNPIHRIVTLKRVSERSGGLIRVCAKKIRDAWHNFGKQSSINIKNFYETNNANILFINSWSALFQKEKIKGMENFKKICIVRGNPESFVWQSKRENKAKAISEAAVYLDQFDECIYVSENGMSAWNRIIAPRPSYNLPNSIDEVSAKEVDMQAKHELRDKLAFDAREFSIVMVGSIQKRKGQDTLLDAMDVISEAIPEVVVHLVGVVSAVWGGKEIVNRIRSSPYHSCFRIHGHRDNAMEFVKAADVAVFTSHAEAFPRTVAEYMALGKPIVASNVSGVPEMINDGINGLLVDPSKPKEFGEAIKKLYFNAALAEKLGRKARDDYYKNFSKKHQIENALRIFQEINEKA